MHIITDGEYQVYTLEMSTLDSWEGQITTLLLYPFDVHGDIELDYIRFLGADAAEGSGNQNFR